MRFDLIVNTMYKAVFRTAGSPSTTPSLWRPILDMRDAVSAYLRAIQADYSISGVFNIASDNYTVGQVGDKVKEKMESLLERRIELELKTSGLPELQGRDRQGPDGPGFEPSHDVSDIIDDLHAHRDGTETSTLTGTTTSACSGRWLTTLGPSRGRPSPIPFLISRRARSAAEKPAPHFASGGVRAASQSHDVRALRRPPSAPRPFERAIRARGVLFSGDVTMRDFDEAAFDRAFADLIAEQCWQEEPEYYPRYRTRYEAILRQFAEKAPERRLDVLDIGGGQLAYLAYGALGRTTAVSPTSTTAASPACGRSGLDAFQWNVALEEPPTKRQFDAIFSPR